MAQEHCRECNTAWGWGRGLDALSVRGSHGQRVLERLDGL